MLLKLYTSNRVEVLLLVTLGFFSYFFAPFSPWQQRINATTLVARPDYDLVFVSRPIADYGSFYVGNYANFEGLGRAMPKDMPGVGARSRFRVCPGGKLMVRRVDGTLVTLIDGSNPASTPFRLVDVNAPDVSYDGQRVIFAGIPEGPYESLKYDPANPTRLGHAKEPGAWRLYVVNADGTGLRQLTTSDQQLDVSQFRGPYGDNVEFSGYDDTDPAWLPDGRVVFSSTRFPVKAQYTGVRATHLYVVNADGTDLHRITTERNSADRPVVDPITGRIVYARWWRNFHYPHHSLTSAELAEQPYTEGVGQPANIAKSGYDTKAGLTGHRLKAAGEQEGILPRDNLFRNSWQLQSVNPDGTDLRMFAGNFREEVSNHAYGGSFSDNGTFFANFFPMFNMTEAAGFGGIRVYGRGPGAPRKLIGVTELQLNNLVLPTSHGIYKSDYAGEPYVLPNGNLIISYVPNTPERILQDYGLYHYDPISQSLTLLYNNAGTAELRAKALRPRPVPPIIADRVTSTPKPLPPSITAIKGDSVEALHADGSFTFANPNVFFNAPVDVPIVSAPKVGEASSIRFYANPQRVNPGSFSNVDWPIPFAETLLDAYGGVPVTRVPANMQLFEQLRTSKAMGYKVPFTGGPNPDGAAHVTGLNFDRPLTTTRCIGCHAGHTMLPIPEGREDQIFSNLAPGADVSVSSSLVDGTRNHARYVASLIDRKVNTVPNENAYKIWTSASGQTRNQWVQLTFKVPIWVKKVRLYDVKTTNSVASQINRATVRLYADAAATDLITSQEVTGPLGVKGEEVVLTTHSGKAVKAQAVRVDLHDGTGRLFQHTIISLGEIEVIASAGDPDLVNGSARQLAPAEYITHENQTDISIHPNPAADFLEIRLPHQHFARPDISIWNATGQLQYAVRDMNIAVNASIRITTSNWSAGIYIVRASEGSKVVTRKVLVSH
ncbi:T9SS type A sorting domain-containing protein [Spirosoma soli]|uniref:T9SS type A sorting domain-containing protein n=1 Tax=Spirosoma soli TaxID=1770529 RepID=A0ABW5LZK7_9BACT